MEGIILLGLAGAGYLLNKDKNESSEELLSIIVIFKAELILQLIILLIKFSVGLEFL